MANPVSAVWNSIVDLYNEMKSGIVYVVANVVNAFTGSCEATCQGRLMTGLNLAITYFTGIDNAKFRRPVLPGDQLRLELTAMDCKRGIWFFQGKAYVDGKLVTEAELKATFADRTEV